MTKNIVLLSDGTGNSSAKAQKTNIWRLFQAIDQSSGDQIALYDNGVGTSTNKYLAAIGGAFGWGLKRNVINLYKFVCRNYQPGDAIYGFGFSRGAFTIRVLVGLIENEGLVLFRSGEELSRNAATAYRHYRAARFPSKSPIVLGLRWVRDVLLWTKDWLKHYRTYEEMAEEIKEKGRKDIRIKFLGLWDTVEAYGIPIIELKRGIDWVLWPMMFGNLKLSPLVDRACHALSLDDERRTFHPLLWDEAAEAEMVERQEVPKGRITQVWFAGMHSNVGGGYPEDQLSLVSLEWIMSEAMASGLKLDPPAVKQISTAKSPYGRLYDSRAELSAYYRYSPRQVPVLSYQGTEIRPIIHGSVVLRMAYGSDRYAPISLPHRFWVLAPDGELLAMEGFDEKLELDATKTRKAGAGLTGDQAAQASTAAADLQRAMSQFEPPARDVVSLVWDTVWWRRIFYFVTVLLTAALVLRPWLSGFFAEATRGSLAWIPRFGDQLSRTYDDVLGEIDKSSQGVVTTFVDTASGFIPHYVQPWKDALQEHPAEFAALVFAIIASLYTSSFLETRIRDRAWLAWHVRQKGDYLEWIGRNQSGWRAGMVIAVVAAVVLLVTAVLRGWPVFAQAGLGVAIAVFALLLIWRLAQRSRFRKPSIHSESLSIPNTLGLSLARKLRNNKVLVTLSRWIFQRVVPIAFAFAVIVLGLFLINRILFDVASAAGAFCTETPQEQRVKPNREVRKEGFSTGASCWPTGIELEKGHRYEIKIETPGDWFNGALRSDVEGYASTTLSNLLATGLKRWWGKDWFKPIARVGWRGNNEHALNPVSFFKPHVYCTDPDEFGGLDAVSEGTGLKTDTRPDANSCERRPTAAARQFCACKQCSRETAQTQEPHGISSQITEESASELLTCSPTPGERKVLTADITASSSGELFLYVNDAVLMLPRWSEAFYANNRGTGTVTVTSLSP
jgi:uncharacterized protein (DUF2235 family)